MPPRTPLIRNSEDQWNVVFIFIFILFSVVLCTYLFQLGIFPRTLHTLDLFFLIFGTYRLIRLVTYDKITDFAREYFKESATSLGKVIYSLLICYWCTGMWFALILVAFYFLSPWWWVFLLILSISWLASLVQNVTNVFTRYAEKALFEQKILEQDERKKNL